MTKHKTPGKKKKKEKGQKPPIFHGTPSVGIAGIFCSRIFVAGMLQGWGAEDGDPWKILPDGGWGWPPGLLAPGLVPPGRGWPRGHPAPGATPPVPPPVVRSGPAGARCRIPAVRWESSLLITYLAGN